jgi:hypothetical protein
MDALKGWFDPSKTSTSQRGYLPLSQDRGGDERSSSALPRSPDSRELTVDDDRKPTHRSKSRNGDHQDELDLLPLDFFGIELHPDTYGLLEDDQALSEAFGSNGQSSLQYPVLTRRPYGLIRLDLSLIGLEDVFSSRIVVICAISACLGGYAPNLPSFQHLLSQSSFHINNNHTHSLYTITGYCSGSTKASSRSSSSCRNSYVFFPRSIPSLLQGPSFIKGTFSFTSSDSVLIYFDRIHY